MLQKEMFLGLQRGKMSRCNSQRGCSWVLGRQMVISQTPLHLNNLIDLTLRYINVWYKVCPFEFLYKENNLMRLVFFNTLSFIQFKDCRMYLYLWVENLHILLKFLTFWDYFQDKWRLAVVKLSTKTLNKHCLLAKLCYTCLRYLNNSTIKNIFSNST